MDFIHDECVSGRRLRCLTMVDECTRECSTIVVDTSLRAERVIESLESFNGRLRDECLNVQQFLSLDDAKTKLAVWQRDYNDHRPHSSLGT